MLHEIICLYLNPNTYSSNKCSLLNFIQLADILKMSNSWWWLYYMHTLNQSLNHEKKLYKTLRKYWGTASWLCVMFSSVFSRMQEKGSKTLMAAWPFELFVSGCRCPMTRKDLAWDIISWIPAIIAYFCSSLSCIHVDEADRQILMHTRM